MIDKLEIENKSKEFGIRPSNVGNAGNLTSDGIWTNTWNYNNWLTNSTNGTTTVRYAYDQSGNRANYSFRSSKSR